MKSSVTRNTLVVISLIFFVLAVWRGVALSLAPNPLIEWGEYFLHPIGFFTLGSLIWYGVKKDYGEETSSN